MSAVVGPTLTEAVREKMEVNAAFRRAQNQGRVAQKKSGLNGSHLHNLKITNKKRGEHGCEIIVMGCNYASCEGAWEIHSEPLS